MGADIGAPIFTSLICELQQARADAEARADDLGRLLADLEALHEPDAGGDCPTCLTEAPCLTLRMLRREIGYGEACVEVRDQHVLGLTADRDGSLSVPTLAELLASPTPAVDRVFETLIGPPADERRSA